MDDKENKIKKGKIAPLPDVIGDVGASDAFHDWQGLDKCGTTEGPNAVGPKADKVDNIIVGAMDWSPYGRGVSLSTVITASHKGNVVSYEIRAAIGKVIANVRVALDGVTVEDITFGKCPTVYSNVKTGSPYPQHSLLITVTTYDQLVSEYKDDWVD